METKEAGDDDDGLFVDKAGYNCGQEEEIRRREPRIRSLACVDLDPRQQVSKHKRKRHRTRGMLHAVT